MNTAAPAGSIIRCIGEVTQSSRNNERCFVRIAVREIEIEIPSADCEAVHLGDTVAYETRLDTFACARVLPAVAALTIHTEEA